MCCPSPVAMQQRAEAQAGTVCARHRKMQSVIRGEGTAPVSPAGRLKHHTHAYLIEPSPTERREERMLAANGLLQACQLFHSLLAGATSRTAASSLSTPFLQLPSLTDHLHQAAQQGLWQPHDCRAPLSCSVFLLPSTYRHLFWATFKQGRRRKGKDPQALDAV